MFPRAIFLALMLAASPAFAIECPMAVRFGIMDFELSPYINGSGPNLAYEPGIAVEWATDALRATGCATEIHWLRMPLRRLQTELTRGDIDFVLGGGPTNERLKEWQWPMGSNGLDRSLFFAKIDTSFFALPGTRIWGENRTLPPGTKIGVVRGSTEQTLASGRNWLIEEAPDIGAGFKMLEAGHVQLMLVQDLLDPAEQRLIDSGKLVKLTPPLATVYHYVPASHAFYGRYGEFTRAFWSEICQAARKSRPQDGECHE